MDNLVQDLRYGFRSLLKHRGFTTVAVITLALGIGANTAIFSVVNGVLLRPLPYKDPAKLVRVYQTGLQRGVSQGAVSPQDFDDWQSQNSVFEHIASYFTYDMNLAGGGEPEAVSTTYVSAEFFSALGAEAYLGRTFLTEENKPGADNVVILSHGFWLRRFGADPKVIGQTIRLNSRPYTVIGVMKSGFQYPAKETRQWAPISLVTDDAVPHRRGIRWLDVIARLKSGETVSRAQADMNAIAGRLALQYQETNSDWGNATVLSLQDQVVKTVRPALLVILGAVAFVLLIACANVANLLLARATSRGKEIAIRLALGATRGRIIRQLLTESVLLGLFGGVLGSLLAYGGLAILLAVNAKVLPRADEVSLDSRALGFALLVSIVTGLCFGLAPAFRISKPDLQNSLKDGGKGSGGATGRHSLRSALVISEIALAVVLVVGAGLMIKSFVRLLGTQPGFNPENVVTVSFNITSNSREIAYYREILSRVAVLPGVVAVGGVKTLPTKGEGELYGFATDGRPGSPSGEVARTRVLPVSEGYFRAMDIPLISGRIFTEKDLDGKPPVGIINQATAKRYWPNESSVGHSFHIGNYTIQIVGVVGDVRQEGLAIQAVPSLYVPHSLFPRSSVMLAVRTTSDPLKTGAMVRDAIHGVNKDQPISEIATMQQLVSESVAQPRFFTLLLGIFASLALALSALGIYGVISYAVGQRTHEIGVRMALGAQQRDILKLIIGHGMGLTLIGLGVGLMAALALTRVLGALLYGVSPNDPFTFTAVTVVLAGVALLACLVPASRAIRVDPMITLRCE